MGKSISIPDNMKSWCVGLWDFGLLDNSQTGHQVALQVHATVTNAGSIPGVGFHISAYNHKDGLIGGGSFSPETALSKCYYQPGTSPGTMIRSPNKGLQKTAGIVQNFRNINHLVSEATEFFFEIYEEYKPPKALPVASDFPTLTSSTSNQSPLVPAKVIPSVWRK